MDAEIVSAGARFAARRGSVPRDGGQLQSERFPGRGATRTGVRAPEAAITVRTAGLPVRMIRR